ncbi:hypothetical protein SDC9_115805 [bioreactor metagenome]|uniref:Uncharacterized protein n=1 Tax=bioreactor metagenome TaxID=1076179 RepID=A0A645BTX0_9ZZZZ
MRIEENDGNDILKGIPHESIIVDENIMDEIYERVDRLDTDESYWYGIDSCIECGIQNVLSRRKDNEKV